MSKNKRDWIATVIVWITVAGVIFLIGWFVGERANIATVKIWESRSKSWQYTAEHYGGICKWLLENKPIYGTVAMDSNTVLHDCLFVSGGEFAIDIRGNSATVMNCTFETIDMGWINSQTTTDPNEFKFHKEGVVAVDIETLDFGESEKKDTIDSEPSFVGIGFILYDDMNKASVESMEWNH